MLNRIPGEILRQFITANEIWSRHIGDHAVAGTVNHFVSQQSHDNRFWEAPSIIHIDYIQKGKTNNAEYYANLLNRLFEEKTTPCSFNHEIID